MMQEQVLKKGKFYWVCPGCKNLVRVSDSFTNPKNKKEYCLSCLQKQK